jgi:hypothetical protein
MDCQLAPAGIHAMAGQNMLAMAPAASTSCGRVLFHIARPAVRSIISTRERVLRHRSCIAAALVSYLSNPTYLNNMMLGTGFYEYAAQLYVTRSIRS